MRLLRHLALVLLLELAPTLPAMAQGFERSLPLWNKEPFSEKDGGLFVEFAFDGFLSPSMQNLAPERVTTKVRNILSNEAFVWTQSSRGQSLWKAPTGKYEIVSIELVDGAGKPRRWAPKTGKRSKPFVVLRQSFSNLGTWTLAPDGPQGLRLQYDDTPPTAKLDSAEERKAVRAIVHGFKGLVQQRLAGDAAETAPQTRIRGGQLEIAVKSVREISIQRRVAVRGASAQDISTVLGGSDPRLRECYKRRLRQAGEGRGSMEMAFLISKETRSFKKLSLTGGDFREQEFVQCVFDELSSLRFDVSTPAVGKITYEFDAKL